MREFLERIPQKLKIAGAILLGVLVIAVILAAALWGGSRKEDASKGMQVIQKMERKDTTDIEASIDELDRVEEERRQRAESGMTAAETFANANAVVVGDSFALGFSDSAVLSASSVVAEESILLSDEEAVQEEMDTVKGLSPKVIFISLGSADIEDTDGDLDLFREEYKKILVEIQRSFEDAKVYVNLITPVKASAYAVSSAYMDVDKYNDILKELCKENNVIAIDNSSLVSEDMYEEDGIALSEKYYSVCAQHLIEMAGL